MTLFVLKVFPFSNCITTIVTPPEQKMMIKSTGANIIYGIGLKRNPSPKRYKCPCSKIISPIYIRSVISKDTIAGTQTESNVFLSSRKEPKKMPTVTPHRIKNMAIRIAEIGDTQRLPSLQNAVKQAKIQSPKNTNELTDCKIKAFRRIFSPVFIICPNP